MWHLVQHNPTDYTHLGCYDNYERAKFIMMNKQRFNSKCFYEILHSSDLVGPDYTIDKSGELIFD